VVIRRLWSVLLGIVLAAMDFLGESLHQVLLGSLVKDGLAVGIRGQAVAG